MTEGATGARAARAPDPVALSQALIRIPSVTPDTGAAQDLLAEALEAAGFTVWRHLWGEAPDGPVANLFARRGTAGPHFAFAGHTDVVPPGAPEDWPGPPFAAEVRDGLLIGRGASDMKSAIAAFVAAAARTDTGAGSVSLIVTGDEEGPATFGTKRLLQWMREEGHVPDHCLVGEPTSQAALGDMVKIGRRGSVNAWITVAGAQGHVAYPHMAANPIPALVEILQRLQSRVLDEGNEWFQPSNLEITDLEVGNPAHNVIPAAAKARLNIRFNNQHRGADLVHWMEDTATSVTEKAAVEAIVSGEAFFTDPGPFAELVAGAIESVTGGRPDLSTSGGTSDARFIRAMCPVIEAGLVGKTMHKVGEAVAVRDIERLTDIYAAILTGYFAPQRG
ncbi:succinyl-diaminopimelate desuccinylase [Pacificimonas flava]|uniref:Succinyl-diaminopimelate desuccinylase n=1 Tax=Pacificimonas flava TaxID=1234595 RepID=M2T5Y5_9SPHN|nr:succinyl-diaminopimelate desuccinylase [Pacificimonas flava]EMD81889.1 N-succinyl-L,L-diaminopimelate desuccinylase [Pacificimonas flava]MBB5281583.1 succinyl-diaminopimelate desuccinylase [Pacificimonas flava]